MSEPITYISDEDIARANAQHDATHPEFRQSITTWDGRRITPRIGGSWKNVGNKVGARLTDKKIAHYEKLGFYSGAMKRKKL